MSALRFQITATSDTCHGRVGTVTTPHGQFETPAFAPVGTRAAIKGLSPDQVAHAGSQIILANTYHLMLRPGSQLVQSMGGLHQWMRWDGPILTDSGGYQVFSLSDSNHITDDGVTFKSHLDGATIELTPERSIQVQNELGADIIMAFDDCPPAMADEPRLDDDDDNTSDKEHPPVQAPSQQRTRHHVLPKDYTQRNEAACRRSVAWLDRCVQAHARPNDQALFGIVQGGTDLDLRSWCVEQITQQDLPGYAIGGVAVGEGTAGIQQVVEHTAPLLPADRPRYLMGVGYERDILMAVRAGIDLFDCVLPTRNGRNGNAFTPTGQIRLKNAKFQTDETVIEPGCDCQACQGGFSRSYLRHLLLSGDMLGPILVSTHNIRYFQRYLLDIRRAITQNDWSLIAWNWPVAVQ